MHIIELIFAISRLLNKQCALDSMVETSKGLPAAYDLCTLNEIDSRCKKKIIMKKWWCTLMEEMKRQNWGSDANVTILWSRHKMSLNRHRSVLVSRKSVFSLSPVQLCMFSAINSIGFFFLSWLRRKCVHAQKNCNRMRVSLLLLSVVVARAILFSTAKCI